VASDATFDQIWPQLCISHYHGEDTSTYMIDRSLMRPRNLLKVFNHSRGFANNFGRIRVEADDIDKGLRAYSQDLLIDLSRELNDVFPGAKDLLYYFLDAKNELSVADLTELISSAGVEAAQVQKILDFLLYYGVVGLRTSDGDYYIFDVNYDTKVL